MSFNISICTPLPPKKPPREHLSCIRPCLRINKFSDFHNYFHNYHYDKLFHNFYSPHSRAVSRGDTRFNRDKSFYLTVKKKSEYFHHIYSGRHQQINKNNTNKTPTFLLNNRLITYCLTLLFSSKQLQMLGLFDFPVPGPLTWFLCEGPLPGKKRSMVLRETKFILSTPLPPPEKNGSTYTKLTKGYVHKFEPVRLRSWPYW